MNVSRSDCEQKIKEKILSLAFALSCLKRRAHTAHTLVVNLHTNGLARAHERRIKLTYE